MQQEIESKIQNLFEFVYFLKRSDPMQVQCLPFEICYDGPANVEKYFKIKSSGPENEKDGNELEASFRGVMLKGCKIDLNENYRVSVCEVKDMKIEKCVEAKGMVFWQYEWETLQKQKTEFRKLMDFIEHRAIMASK